LLCHRSEKNEIGIYSMAKKICLPCEREKARLPMVYNMAKQRAKDTGKLIAVYFDEEDKRYMATDLETARAAGYIITAYFTPL
jgi:hypothetical protein